MKTKEMFKIIYMHGLKPIIHEKDNGLYLWIVLSTDRAGIAVHNWDE